MCSVYTHVYYVHLFSVCTYDMVSTWCLLLIISQVVSSLDCCCVCGLGVPMVHMESLLPTRSHLRPWESPLGVSLSTSFSSGNWWTRKTGLESAGRCVEGKGFWVCWALFEQAAALGAVCLWTPSGKSLPLPKQSSAACLTWLECSKSCDVMYSRLPRGVWMWCLHYLCYCSLLLVQIIKTCFLSPDARSLDLSTGFMFMSAAVNSKSKAVGFSFKLFNSFIDKYLL